MTVLLWQVMKKKRRRRRRQVHAVDDFNSFSETLHCYLVISPPSALPETLTITLLSHSKMRISECVFCSQFRFAGIQTSLINGTSFRMRVNFGVPIIGQ
jgi:hypothetical protein